MATTIDDVSLASTVVVRDTEEQFAVVTEERQVVISEGTLGPPGDRGAKGDTGDQGDPGPAAFVSTDPYNMTTVGGDGGIYTPDVVTDPLAHYILAKS